MSVLYYCKSKIVSLLNLAEAPCHEDTRAHSSMHT